MTLFERTNVTESPAMPARKKLIFFAASDPLDRPGPAWSAYHFAEVASKAGLEAEVRLAGDAVKVALPGMVEASSKGEELLQKVKRGVGGRFLVSL